VIESASITLKYFNQFMKNIIFGLSLVLMTLDLAAQTPSVSLSLDKTSINEAGGVATLTATLSAPTSQTVTIALKPSGTATDRVDYEASFTGKGEAITVAGGNGQGSAANQLSSLWCTPIVGQNS
jgi:hypothetical protein